MPWGVLLAAVCFYVGVMVATARRYGFFSTTHAEHQPSLVVEFAEVASPFVVYERVKESSVAGSLLLVEASEAATAGPQGPEELTTASSS